MQTPTATVTIKVALASATAPVQSWDPTGQGSPNNGVHDLYPVSPSFCPFHLPLSSKLIHKQEKQPIHLKTLPQIAVVGIAIGFIFFILIPIGVAFYIRKQNMLKELNEQEEARSEQGLDGVRSSMGNRVVIVGGVGRGKADVLKVLG